MNLAMGAALLWMGGALLWVATHDTGAATPWEAYTAILNGLRGTGADAGATNIGGPSTGVTGGTGQVLV